jgi:hypothetical protein
VSALPCSISHKDASLPPLSITVAEEFILVLPVKPKLPLFTPCPVFWLRNIFVPHLYASAPDAAATF